MNYVTFSITETRNGWFVLRLHNHGQGKVYVKKRSRNLEEVVKTLRGGLEYRRRFMNALAGYVPVLERIDRLKAACPEAAGQPFPDDWQDPLALYGAYGEQLLKAGARPQQEREALRPLLEAHGPRWVWDNRLRLAAERLHLLEF